MKQITLIVTDSGPLITLAVADALDTLLRTGQRVLIPDMVRFEVTRLMDKPGAAEILDWIRDNEPGRVFCPSTEEFEEFAIVFSEKPNARTKGRGEKAAAEVLERELRHGLDVGILLFEDSDVRKDNFLTRVPDNVLIMSTSEYLFGLERAHLIESAASIIARAVPVRGSEILERYLRPMEGAEEVAENWQTHLKPSGG